MVALPVFTPVDELSLVDDQEVTFGGGVSGTLAGRGIPSTGPITTVITGDWAYQAFSVIVDT